MFKNNSWGFIDENGSEIIPPTFADCGEYRNGRAFYSVDGLTYGFLTLDTSADTSAQPTPPSSGNSGYVGTHDELITENTENIIPMIPPSGKIISMKIGSNYATKQTDMKILSQAPALIDGLTMVPLRDLVEYMGGELVWESARQRTNITYNWNRVIMTLGSKIAYVNGIATVLPAAPVLINGVTMIPVRSVTAGLGCYVEWIPEAQNIYIHY